MIKWRHVVPVNDKNALTVHGYIRKASKEINDITLPNVLIKMIILYYLIMDKFRKCKNVLNGGINVIRYEHWNEIIILKDLREQSLQSFGCYFGSFLTSISALKLYEPKLKHLRYNKDSTQLIIYNKNDNNNNNNQLSKPSVHDDIYNDNDNKDNEITSRGGIHCDVNSHDVTLYNSIFYSGCVVEWSVLFHSKSNKTKPSFKLDEYKSPNSPSPQIDEWKGMNNWIGIQSGSSDIFSNLINQQVYVKNLGWGPQWVYDTEMVDVFAAFFSAESGILYTYNLEKEKSGNDFFSQNCECYDNGVQILSGTHHYIWKKTALCDPKSSYLKEEYLLYVRLYTGKFQLQFGYSPPNMYPPHWLKPIDAWVPCNRHEFGLAVLPGTATKIQIKSFSIKDE